MSIIKLSPIAPSYYGVAEVPEESILNYGKALLVISGGDGEVSPQEQEWFDTYFCELLKLPEQVTNEFRTFDPLNANLEDLLSDIIFETQLSTSLLLVYDCIRMAKADNDFAKEEAALVRRVAEILSIPPYKVKAIEHFVDAENSLIETKKAIFEVDYTKTPTKPLPKKSLIQQNSWVRMNFGHTITTYQSLESYYHMMLAISGADGDVSEPEMKFLELIAMTSGAPDPIIEGLRSFDYRNVSISELISTFVTDTFQNMERISIYLAIKMAGADGVYAEEERDSVANAAELLRVDKEVLEYLEHIVEIEAAHDTLKHRLLS
jgi:uncharacterized tellurite resistance protein B-like protein